MDGKVILPPREFHEAWMTVGPNRFKISVRDGFPTAFHQQLGVFVSGFLGTRGLYDARILTIFDDDTHSVLNVFIASTNPEDAEVMLLLDQVLDLYYHPLQVDVKFDLYPEDPHRHINDHYDHAAYLHRCALNQ